ncbi:MAG: glutamate decarboxylase, partial [Eggerthellaceae bacterium]|nr:glutamate decarboxylase [Eggerthellaceae bacterium]
VDEIKGMGIFKMLEEATEIPILCWRLADGVEKPWTLYDLDDRLRMHGWQIPAYPLPPNMEDVTCQRIVCRADLSMALAIKFVADMKAEIAHLDAARIVSGEGAGGADSKAAHFDHSGR